MENNKTVKKKNPKQGVKRKAGSDEVPNAANEIQNGIQVVAGKTENRITESSKVVFAVKKPVKKSEKKLSSRELDLLKKHSVTFKDLNDKRITLLTSRRSCVDKIASLRSDFARPPSMPVEPFNNATHWDSLLEEMMWMATDFIEETKFKLSVSAQLATAVKMDHQNKQLILQTSNSVLDNRHKLICKQISRGIAKFWDTQKSFVSNIAFVCGDDEQQVMYPSEEISTDVTVLIEESTRPLSEVIPSSCTLDALYDDIRYDSLLMKQHQLAQSPNSTGPWKGIWSLVPEYSSLEKQNEEEDEYLPSDLESDTESTIAEQERLAPLGDFPLISEKELLEIEASENIESVLSRYEITDDASDDESMDEDVEDIDEKNELGDLLILDESRDDEFVINICASALEIKQRVAGIEWDCGTWVPPRLLSTEGLRRLNDVEKHALLFMATMHENQLCCVFADEHTGFGKEKTVVTFFASLAGERNEWGPHLVITDSKKVTSWLICFKILVPSLSVAVGYSNMFSNVCIMTYDEVEESFEMLQRQPWSEIVWDLQQEVNDWVQSVTPLLRSKGRTVICKNYETAQHQENFIAFVMFHRVFGRLEDVDNFAQAAGGRRKKKDCIWKQLVENFTVPRTLKDFVAGEANIIERTETYPPSIKQLNMIDRLFQKTTGLKIEEKRMQFLSYLLISSHPNLAVPSVDRASYVLDHITNEFLPIHKILLLGSSPCTLVEDLYEQGIQTDVVSTSLPTPQLITEPIRMLDLQESTQKDLEYLDDGLKSLTIQELRTRKPPLLDRTLFSELRICESLAPTFDLISPTLKDLLTLYVSPAIANLDSSEFHSHNEIYPRQLETKDIYWESIGASGILKSLVDATIPRLLKQGRNKLLVIAHDNTLADLTKTTLSYSRISYVSFSPDDADSTLQIALHRFLECASIHIALIGYDVLKKLLDIGMGVEEGLAVADTMVILDDPIHFGDDYESKESVEDMAKVIANARLKNAVYKGGELKYEFTIEYLGLFVDNEPAYFQGFEIDDVINKLRKKEGEEDTFRTRVEKSVHAMLFDSNLEDIVRVTEVAVESTPFDPSLHGIETDLPLESSCEDVLTTYLSCDEDEDEKSSLDFYRKRDFLFGDDYSDYSSQEEEDEDGTAGGDREPPTKRYIVDLSPRCPKRLRWSTSNQLEDQLTDVYHYATNFICGDGEMLIVDQKRLPETWKSDYTEQAYPTCIDDLSIKPHTLEESKISFNKATEEMPLFYSASSETNSPQDHVREVIASMGSNSSNCIGHVSHIYGPPVAENLENGIVERSHPPAIAHIPPTSQQMILTFYQSRNVTIPKPSQFENSSDSRIRVVDSASKLQGKSDDGEKITHGSKAVDWDVQHAKPILPHTRFGLKKQKEEISWKRWEDSVILRGYERFGCNFDLISTLLNQIFNSYRTATQVSDRLSVIRMNWKFSRDTPWVTGNNVKDIASWSSPPLHRADLLYAATTSNEGHVSPLSLPVPSDSEKRVLCERFAAVTLSTPTSGSDRRVEENSMQRTTHPSQVIRPPEMNSEQPFCFSQVIANIVRNQCYDKAHQSGRSMSRGSIIARSQSFGSNDTGPNP